jgi:hypothetical protein
MSPVRRVRRVIRRIDPWTVLKVSFVFNAIMALAFVLGSIIFWSIFVNAGIPEDLTDFAESLTLSFEVDGELYFRVVLFLSVIWAILMTGLATLGSVLYNLIADTVGGVEVVVLEEVIAPMAAPGGSSAIRPVRRPVRQRPASKQPTTPPKGAVTPTPAKAVPPATPETSGKDEAEGDKASSSDLPTAETRVAP